MSATATSAAITNIAAYKFVRLDRLSERRRDLRALTHDLGLKGTILLSPEGINLFLAGEPAAISGFTTELRRDPAFADLQVKESPGDRQPFSRMLVKIKREIIAFGIPEVDPTKRTSPKLTPQELRKWLAEGRDITLYDVRNDYEVSVGTFHNAVPAGIDHFRDFPKAVARLPEEAKHRPVVMFCTGGIRCEKAGPFMEQAGFEQVYQLDGGILKYFEECGGDFYDGECFVFDHRVAVDPRLEESATVQCYVCQRPLTVAEQQSPDYVIGERCPHCRKTDTERRDELRIRRRKELLERTVVLPGSIPAVNRRPISVPGRLDGVTLMQFLTDVFPHIEVEEWQTLIAQGMLQKNEQPVDAEQIVRGGERYERVTPADVEPDVNADIQWIDEDDAWVIIDKPAPLPVHPSGRYDRNTLVSILNPLYAPFHLRPAHRLDANTTGLQVLCKTRTIARQVQSQFERGEVAKTYLAKVVGIPTWDEYVSDVPISADVTAAGGRKTDATGQPAVTEFRTIRRFDDGTALLLAKPRTGRTNQIRVHLWDLGLPVINDPMYLPKRDRCDVQTRRPHAEPMGLHAWKLSLRHPTSGEIAAFTAPWPTWAGSENFEDFKPA